MERCGQGVIGIEAKHCVGAVRNADANVVQRMGNLAITIQLIPENIGHHHGLCIHIGGYHLKGRLIRLDERIGIAALSAEGAGIGCKLCGYTAEEICTGLIGEEGDSRIGHGLLDHSRRSGLAVGARNDHSRYALCQPPEQIRADLQRNSARHVRAASAQLADGKPGEFAHKNSKRSFDVHNFRIIACFRIFGKLGLALPPCSALPAHISHSVH